MSSDGVPWQRLSFITPSDCAASVPRLSIRPTLAVRIARVARCPSSSKTEVTIAETVQVMVSHRNLHRVRGDVRAAQFS
jgi:hypothetical protein